MLKYRYKPCLRWSNIFLKFLNLGMCGYVQVPVFELNDLLVTDTNSRLNHCFPFIWHLIKLGNLIQQN
jgi:hypothetical protein